MYPERVTGVVPDLSTGMFGQKAFTLVITNYRLIFAEVTNELLEQERERSVAGAQNSGFMGKWKASMASHTNFHERYFRIPPQAILQESPNNYELGPQNITWVKIIGTQYDQDFGKQAQNKLIINSSFGKKKFNFQRMNTNQVRDLLLPLLGPKVR